MGQTGYGRIDNNLFIFMNMGIPGVDGMDYDPRTASVSWCAKKKKHSGQEQMQKIINGDLDLYLFARWERNEDWTYLGEAHVLSYEDNVVVADPEGNETFCMEYRLTCKGIEEDLCEEEIESGILTLIDIRPKGKVRKKTKKIGDLGEDLVMRYEKKVD